MVQGKEASASAISRMHATVFDAYIEGCSRSDIVESLFQMSVTFFTLIIRSCLATENQSPSQRAVLQIPRGLGQPNKKKGGHTVWSKKVQDNL